MYSEEQYLYLKGTGMRVKYKQRYVAQSEVECTYSQLTLSRPHNRQLLVQ